MPHPSSGRRTVPIALALVVAGAADVVGACGDADPPALAPALDAGVGSDGPALDGPAPDAPPPWGISSRPTNASCFAPARDTADAKVKLEWVFQTIRPEQPTEIVAAPKGLASLTLFVLEQRGQAIGINPASAAPLVAIDLQSKVTNSGESGLLGLAFHPSFATRRFVYMYYTRVHPDPLSTFQYQNVVMRYAVGADGTFDPATETLVIAIDQPTTLHNGGKLAFGPDGFLYVSTGEGTEPAVSQDLTSLRGKLLRIDVDGAAPYTIPPTNPRATTGGGVRAELWAWGFRNPWRFSFDRASGDLWVGDVGQSSWEEMNKVEAGGNYGWPIREGAHCLVEPCDPGGFIDPVVEHPNADTSAMVGGVVYRGTAIPALAGKLVYGTFGGPIYALETDAVSGAPKPVLLNPDALDFHPSAFTEGQDGEIYFAEWAQNAVFAIKPAALAAASPIPDRLSKTGCVDAKDPKKLAPGLVPFGVASELWADGAAKERAFAIPDGTRLTVASDGKLVIPPRSVTMKTFTIGGRRAETRLFVRHDDGGWSGFTYAWNEAETDAELVAGNRTAKVGTASWYWPSRAECLKCHNDAAGRSLGLELAQLETDFSYPNGARGNQIDNLLHADLLDRTPPRSPSTLAGTPRGYLHTNCSNCHRPGAATAAFDLRATSTLADVCNASPKAGDLGVAGARLLLPGDPSKSLVSLRMHRLGAGRMPPLATRLEDPAVASLIDPWIRTAACR